MGWSLNYYKKKRKKKSKNKPNKQKTLKTESVCLLSRIRFNFYFFLIADETKFPVNIIREHLGRSDVGFLQQPQSQDYIDTLVIIFRGFNFFSVF